MECFRATSYLPAKPDIVPESITVDRGKVCVGFTFTAACERLQISITKAALRTPTDKPHIERFFAGVNTGFTQHLAGYTGPNVVRRGKAPAAESIFTLAEVQNLLDWWLVAVWQDRPHPGLRRPAMPKKETTSPSCLSNGVRSRPTESTSTASTTTIRAFTRTAVSLPGSLLRPKDAVKFGMTHTPKGRKRTVNRGPTWCSESKPSFRWPRTSQSPSSRSLTTSGTGPAGASARSTTAPKRSTGAGSKKATDYAAQEHHRSHSRSGASKSKKQGLRAQ